jgi:hypothetical protein
MEIFQTLVHSPLMFAVLIIGPPLLDLGLVQRVECLWRLLIARKNLLTKTGEPRECTVGSARALTVAALSLAMMAFGVPLGKTQSSEPWHAGPGQDSEKGRHCGTKSPCVGCAWLGSAHCFWPPNGSSTMSMSCKRERSLLSHEEHETVRVTHHPAIYEHDVEMLRTLRVRLRQLREKERTLARQKQREVRGKAESRGGSFPGIADLPLHQNRSLRPH